MATTSFFGYQLTSLKADFEFERFFPTNDPDIAFYEDHLQKFGYDNDYLILIISNHKGVFEEPFLNEVNVAIDSIEKLDNITSVFALTNARQPVQGPMGITPIPLIHIDQPDLYQTDSTKLVQHPVYSNFLSHNAQSLLIQLNHSHLSEPQQAKALNVELENLIKHYNFDKYRLAGKVIAQEAFVGYIQNDFVVFLIAALVTSFLLLLWIFKSLKVALMPYLVSITSLIWLLGTMAWLGYSISILGSLIPPVILFVSTSDSIHLINAFRNTQVSDHIQRLKAAVNKVLVPTLLTSVTTAVGFFSLWTIDTLPIRELGMFCGLGICIAFIITFLFGPIMIKRSYPPIRPDQRMKRLAIWNLRNQKPVFLAWLALLIIAAVGMSLLKTDSYLLKDLPGDSQVRKDFTYVDEQFGGSKPWEIALWPAGEANSLLDYEVILEIDKIEAYLRDTYQMERVVSPATLVRFTNQMNSGGLVENFKLPSKTDHNKIIRSLDRLLKRDQLPKVIHEKSYGRIAAFIPEYGTYETIRRNQQLQKFIESAIDRNILQTRLTGTTYLIDKSHEVLSYNLLKGLVLGILVISLLLGIYFRSIKILLISLIPNIIPLIAVAGFMGLTGAPLKLTTSVIFAVTFGIAVDDTIHFLAVFRKSKAKSSVQKLINTYQSAGKAILLTTVIIVSGFFLFILSSFGATYYLGLFMTISLAIALLTDLTLLPLLLHLFKTKETQR